MPEILGSVSSEAEMEMDDRTSRGTLSINDADLYKDDHGYYLSNVHFEGDGMDGEIARLDLDQELGHKLHMLSMIETADNEGELAEALASEDDQVLELAIAKQEELRDEEKGGV